MKTFNKVLTLNVIAAVLSLTGCVANREHVQGRYEEERHDHDATPSDDKREEERAERRERDDRCAIREPSGECRDK